LEMGDSVVEVVDFGLRVENEVHGFDFLLLFFPFALVDFFIVFFRGLFDRRPLALLLLILCI
jgi:hypothetical protein